MEVKMRENMTMSYAHLIGQDYEKVTAELQASNTPWRLTYKDGEAYFGTCDYVINRVNLGVTNGKVKSVSMG
jgi:hypothetical protein